jgi:hypothetical protein
MDMGIVDRLDQLTGTSQKTRDALFGTMVKMSDHERGKLFAATHGNCHKYDKTHPDRIRYGFNFIFQVEMVVELNKRSQILKRGLKGPGTPDAVRVNHDKRVGKLDKIGRERKKRRASKESLLNKILPELIEAKQKDHSWETLSEYVEKSYRVKISRETIRKKVSPYIETYASARDEK